MQNKAPQIRVNSSFPTTLSLLGVLFVGLKLGHVIDWSWWWVTAPFWGGPALLLALFLIALALFILGGTVWLLWKVVASLITARRHKKEMAKRLKESGHVLKRSPTKPTGIYLD